MEGGKGLVLILCRSNVYRDECNRLDFFPYSVVRCMDSMAEMTVTDSCFGVPPRKQSMLK